VAALVFAATPRTQMAGPDPNSLVAGAFVYAMRDLDWVDGRSITIERRSAEGQPERERFLPNWSSEASM
jgi:hypothetical protein